MVTPLFAHWSTMSQCHWTSNQSLKLCAMTRPTPSVSAMSSTVAARSASRLRYRDANAREAVLPTMRMDNEAITRHKSVCLAVSKFFNSFLPVALSVPFFVV